PWLSAVAEDCHAEGPAVVIPLTHLGPRNSNFTADWLPLISAGRHREPAHPSVTKAVEDFDIDRVVDEGAAAAARIRAAGFDGLEFLHTGHLIDYFFASRFNDREDEYNGDLTARLRFPLRIIDAMRAEADGMALGVRMSVLEQVDDGLTEDL